MRPPIAPLLVGVLLSALVAGCAARCRRVANIRAAVEQRGGRAEGPHAVVRIPYATANREIARRLGRSPVASVQLPSVPGIGVSLGRVRVRLGHIAMGPAASGHLGFRVELDVLDGNRALATLDLDAQVRPKIDARTGTVEASLRPADIRRVRPRLSNGSAQRLAGMLYDELPSAARMLVSKSDLADVAATLLTELVPRSWPTIRRELLADVGELTRFEVDLPDLPIRAIEVESGPHAVRLAIRTTLPVTDGLPPTLPPAGQGQLTVALSGAAVAELANHAMSTGAVPARYDESGAPDPDGPLRPTFAWQPGRRPLVAHVFDARDDCIYLELRATPKAEVVADRVEVRVDDGVIARAQGPTKLRLWAWSTRMGRNALTATESFATSLKLDLGGQPVKLRVRSIRQSDAVVTLGLSM